MNERKIAEGKRSAPAWRQRLFTVEDATKAVVFVSKVVEDIVTAYEDLLRLRSEQQELSLVSGADGRLAELRVRIEQRVEQLKRLTRELDDVGCKLKDSAAGLVDFPARFEGREVALCWRLGEPEVAHWHERNGGFSDRRPVDAEFRQGSHELSTAETGALEPG